MKIFVFSDSHLNKKYDPEFIEWIKHWSKDVDKVIICGDFWDRFFLTFDEFIKTKWSEELFPLLKSKDTHYIYGNHDPKDRANDKVDLFSNTQSEQLDLDIAGKTFHFEHGERFGIPIDAGDCNFLGKIGHWAQEVIIMLFGYKAMYIFSNQVNNVRRIWGDDKRFLVCGHTHYGAQGKNYFVLKPSNFGLKYGLIIEDGNLIEVKGYEQVKEGK